MLEKVISDNVSFLLCKRSRCTSEYDKNILFKVGLKKKKKN